MQTEGLWQLHLGFGSGISFEARAGLLPAFEGVVGPGFCEDAIQATWIACSLREVEPDPDEIEL